MKNSNVNLTQLDTDQIIKKKFDEQMDADRVVIVGGDKIELQVDSDKIGQAIGKQMNDYQEAFVKAGQQWLQNQQNSYQNLQQPIEKAVYIPKLEIKEIEKQVIVPQIEYKTIEVPIIIEKITTVEVPVIVKEIEFKEIIKEKEFPLWMKVCFGLQTFALIGLLIKFVIK